MLYPKQTYVLGTKLIKYNMTFNIVYLIKFTE